MQSDADNDIVADELRGNIHSAENWLSSSSFLRRRMASFRRLSWMTSRR